MAARWFENVWLKTTVKAGNSRRLSIFFGILAFASVIAVMGLTPLKTVETTIIRVDRNSGYMDVIRPDGKRRYERGCR